MREEERSRRGGDREESILEKRERENDNGKGGENDQRLREE